MAQAPEDIDETECKASHVAGHGPLLGGRDPPTPSQLGGDRHPSVSYRAVGARPVLASPAANAHAGL